ncbi:MAG: hypothetical protein ABR552_04580 [Actinomycetota bacterium]
MSILALGYAFWIVGSILLLFGALVVLTFALGLVRQVKAVARRMEGARTSLGSSLADARAETERAAELVQSVTARRRQAAGRRRGRGVS